MTSEVATEVNKIIEKLTFAWIGVDGDLSLIDKSLKFITSSN